MPGARSPTLEEIQNLYDYADKVALYTALYGAEKARLVLGQDVRYITEKVKELKENMKTN